MANSAPFMLDLRCIALSSSRHNFLLDHLHILVGNAEIPSTTTAREPPSPCFSSDQHDRQGRPPSRLSKKGPTLLGDMRFQRLHFTTDRHTSQSA